jgi:hypothetical protein
MKKPKVLLLRLTEKMSPEPGFPRWTGVRPAPCTNFRPQIKLLSRVG